MHPRVPRLLLGLLVFTATVSTGCLAGDSDGDTDAPDGATSASADWHERAVAHGDDHDHRDPAHHVGLSTPNFEVLGHDPLETAYHGASSGGYFCGDVSTDGERDLAFVHSFTTDVAFVVADVTDAANPQIIGELVLPRTHVYDLASTPDGTKVILGTSTPDAPDSGAPVRVAGEAPARALDAPFFRDACTGEERPVRGLVAGPEGEAPYGSGVVLVDVTDPADPVIADYEPQPVLGAHSVFATTIGDTDLVLASTTNLAHPGSYFHFYSTTDTPLGPQLVLESTYRPAPVGEEAAALNGHVDGWIAEHPGTGDVLAYLADWNGGLVILDLNDPKTPREEGRWSNYAGDAEPGSYTPDSGSVHGTLPLPELRDGTHYTIIGQEVVTRPRDTPTGLITIMDTTDPANPHAVSAWTLPANPEWGGDLMWSTHYFRVVGDTLFVAMYHGGVWAVDISDPATPRSVGAFVPNGNHTLSDAGHGFGDWAPTVLDLDVRPDGSLVVWDGPSGVYVVRFDASAPAPAVEESAVPVGSDA